MDYQQFLSRKAHDGAAHGFEPIWLPPTPLILNLTTCARLRGQQAAVDGDRARYWRELAGAMRLLGWSDSAADFERLGEVPRG